MGSVPGLGRSPGEGNGNPLQYSCVENSMDRGAWQATVQGVAKSPNTTEHKCMWPVQSGKYVLNELENNSLFSYNKFIKRKT